MITPALSPVGTNRSPGATQAEKRKATRTALCGELRTLLQRIDREKLVISIKEQPNRELKLFVHSRLIRIDHPDFEKNAECLGSIGVGEILPVI